MVHGSLPRFLVQMAETSLWCNPIISCYSCSNMAPKLMYQCMEVPVNVNHMPVVYFKILFYSEIYIYPGTVKFVEKNVLTWCIYTSDSTSSSLTDILLSVSVMSANFSIRHTLYMYMSVYFIGNLIEFLIFYILIF